VCWGEHYIESCSGTYISHFSCSRPFSPATLRQLVLWLQLLLTEGHQTLAIDSSHWRLPAECCSFKSDRRSVSHSISVWIPLYCHFAVLSMRDALSDEMTRLSFTAVLVVMSAMFNFYFSAFDIISCQESSSLFIFVYSCTLRYIYTRLWSAVPRLEWQRPSIYRTTYIIELLIKLSPETGTRSVDLTQLSRCHLKMETESLLRKVAL
jgi:hypothetical protein